MTAEFHNLEESLKAFLIEANSDSYNAKNANLYKYNNLKVFMDTKKSKLPHFIVRVGMSESMYTLNNCERINGSLGPDEKYIHRWFEKPHIKSEMQNCWKLSQKAITVQMRNEDDF